MKQDRGQTTITEVKINDNEKPEKNSYNNKKNNTKDKSNILGT